MQPAKFSIRLLIKGKFFKFLFVRVFSDPDTGTGLVKMKGIEPGSGSIKMFNPAQVNKRRCLAGIPPTVYIILYNARVPKATWRGM